MVEKKTEDHNVCGGFGHYKIVSFEGDEVSKSKKNIMLYTEENVELGGRNTTGKTNVPV